jgi:hypothetical protein
MMTEFTDLSQVVQACAGQTTLSGMAQVCGATITAGHDWRGGDQFTVDTLAGRVRVRTVWRYIASGPQCGDRRRDVDIEYIEL